MSFIAGSSQKTLLVLYIKAALRTCVVFFTPRLFLLVLFFVDDCHRAHSVPLEASCSFSSEFTAQVPHSWHCPGCDFSCTPVRECLSSASPLSLTCHRSTFFFTHFQIFRTPLIWNVECESQTETNPLAFLQDRVRSHSEMSVNPKFTLQCSCFTIDFSSVAVVRSALALIGQQQSFNTQLWPHQWTIFFYWNINLNIILVII